MRLIVRRIYSYSDLVRKFGPHYQMPPMAFAKEDEIVYRCPYIPDCEAGKHCFAAATSAVPLQDNVILNIKCPLMGGKKLPVYACEARVN